MGFKSVTVLPRSPGAVKCALALSPELVSELLSTFHKYFFIKSVFLLSVVF